VRFKTNIAAVHFTPFLRLRNTNLMLVAHRVPRLWRSHSRDFNPALPGWADVKRAALRASMGLISFHLPGSNAIVLRLWRAYLRGQKSLRESRKESGQLRAALWNALPSGVKAHRFLSMYVRAEARTLQGGKTYTRAKALTSSRSMRHG
jgi:hypothetical protein